VPRVQGSVEPAESIEVRIWQEWSERVGNRWEYMERGHGHLLDVRKTDTDVTEIHKSLNNENK
jgi:hypothetical protein